MTPYRRRKFNRHMQRKGTVVVLAAFMLIIVFAMVAFTVDVGHITHFDTELQRTADACAMAAIQQLPDEEQAFAAAKSVERDNQAISVSQVEFGTWDRALAEFDSGTAAPNAVRVVVERTAQQGNALDLSFGKLLGRKKADVVATAICMYDNDICGPLIGIDWVNVPGTPRTDSFRSGRGPYESQTPGRNGSLCSDGPIQVEGDAQVHGNANPGRGEVTTTEGGAVVTGNTSPRLRPLNIPGVDLTEAANWNNNDSLPKVKKGNNLHDALDSHRNLIIDGGRSFEMPAGDFYINDLILAGQSTLNITGKTRLYLTGKLDTSGGKLANTTRVASNLHVIMSGSSATVTGNSHMFAFIFAPNTDVEVRGSGQFSGAVVGKTLTVTGSGAIHYDEDLNLVDSMNAPKRVALVR